MPVIYDANDAPIDIGPNDLLKIGNLNGFDILVNATTTELVKPPKYSTPNHIFFDENGQPLPTKESIEKYYASWRWAEYRKVLKDYDGDRNDFIIFMTKWHQYIRQQVMYGWDTYTYTFDMDEVKCMFQWRHCQRGRLFEIRNLATIFIRHVWPKMKAAMIALKYREARHIRGRLVVRGRLIAAITAIERFNARDMSFFAKLQ